MAEKMLTNWFTFLLYKFLKVGGCGGPAGGAWPWEPGRGGPAGVPAMGCPPQASTGGQGGAQTPA